MPGSEPPIYLDFHATTPVDPRVLEAMLPYFREKFGNASSRSHAFGWEAEKAVEAARGQVARLFGADPREIVFTSGATESNNLALKGCARALRERGRRIVTGPTEHPSVRDTLAALAREGFEIDTVPVGPTGRLDPDAVAEAVARPGTILVTAMAANNEIGTLHPVREIGRLAAQHGCVFHSDATQAVGKVAFDVVADGVHLAALSAHKIYGPKGCGALYVRRKDPAIRLEPILHGGGQERGMRAGTLNVAGIVGLGMACELCEKEREEEGLRLSRLRDRLLARLRESIPDLRVNGDPEHRLPGNLHVSLPGVEADALMLAVPHLAVSSGSACASGSLEPSPVLRALGLSPQLARSSIRFGLGRTTTEAEIDRAAADVVAAHAQFRRHS